MSSSVPDKSTKSTAKGILIMILLVVLAGAGGYFFGTYQKFAPIQTVPGTSGIVDQSSSSVPFAINVSNLKNKYWIHSSGHEHVGYAITAFVNGQKIDKFFTPDRDVDITKYVKPGENQVTFQAEVLPASMNEHQGDSYYHLNLAIRTGRTIQGEKSETLLNYKRNATETENFNDTLTFTTLE